MGCQQSKRAGDVAAGAHSPSVMRPSTPSFQPRESLAARAGGELGAEAAAQGAELEEMPSFVLSTTSDLIKSSDSEAVQGMVGAFTFSFIQVSESSVSSSSGLDSSSSASASDDDRLSEVEGEAGDCATEQMPPIPEEAGEHKDEQGGAAGACGSEDPPERSGAQTSREPASDTRAVAAGIVDELVASSVSAASNARDHVLRLSAATNESDDIKEYLVTESGDVRVALDVATEEQGAAAAHHAAADLDTSDDPTAAVVAALVDEVIESALMNAEETAVLPDAELGLADADMLIEEPVTDRDPLSKGYSTMTNPSSTELNDQSTRTFEVVEESTKGDMSPWTYAVVGSSVSAEGVVLYHIQLTDGTANKWPTPVLKRYSDFKQLRSTLKASGVVATVDFPPLPRAGLSQLMRGKLSKRTIAQRELQFSAILRFIAQHRGLQESAAFRSFVGQ